MGLHTAGDTSQRVSCTRIKGQRAGGQSRQPRGQEREGSKVTVRRWVGFGDVERQAERNAGPASV